MPNIRETSVPSVKVLDPKNIDSMPIRELRILRAGYISCINDFFDRVPMVEEWEMLRNHYDPNGEFKSLSKAEFIVRLFKKDFPGKLPVYMGDEKTVLVTPNKELEIRRRSFLKGVGAAMMTLAGAAAGGMGTLTYNISQKNYENVFKNLGLNTFLGALLGYFLMGKNQRDNLETGTLLTDLLSLGIWKPSIGVSFDVSMFPEIKDSLRDLCAIIECIVKADIRIEKEKTV